MDLPNSRHLSSAIANLRKLQLIPPVYIYTVATQGKGLAAVDIDKHNLHLAYSPGHSRDIYVKLNHDSETDLTGNLEDAWTKHGAENTLNSKSRITENPVESAQVYVFQHGADVTGLHFTHDGNLLLSCGLDGTVKVWSVASLQLVQSYYATSGVISDIHVSVGSTSFVTALRVSYSYQGCSALSEAVLYNFETKYPISTFRGHTGDIECVRFHPNGLYIATASSDKTIKLWCMRTSKEVRKFYNRDCHEGHPKKLAFSPDGKYLASTYYESVRIWDLASGEMLRCLAVPNPNPHILNLCYNTTGNVLAAGGSNKKLHLWSMKSGSSGCSDGKLEEDLLKYNNLDNTVYCIKFTSNLFSCVTAHAE